jgi:hypothetical protein
MIAPPQYQGITPASGRQRAPRRIPCNPRGLVRLLTRATQLSCRGWPPRPLSANPLTPPSYLPLPTSLLPSAPDSLTPFFPHLSLLGRSPGEKTTGRHGDGRTTTVQAEKNQQQRKARPGSTASVPWMPAHSPHAFLLLSILEAVLSIPTSFARPQSILPTIGHDPVRNRRIGDTIPRPSRRFETSDCDFPRSEAVHPDPPGIPRSTFHIPRPTFHALRSRDIFR